MHIPSLHLTPTLSFEPLTVTTQKTNACIPWIPCLDLQYTINALYRLDGNERLLQMFAHPINSRAFNRISKTVYSGNMIVIAHLDK